METGIFRMEIKYTEHWELWMKVIYDRRKDIRLTATGSASPVLEKGTTDSGTGRWSVFMIPTMSFYEYCRLLQIEEPVLPEHLKLTKLVEMSHAEFGNLLDGFTPLEGHFTHWEVTPWPSYVQAVLYPQAQTYNLCICSRRS